MQRETRHRSRSRSKPASSHHNHNHDTAPQPLAASEDGPAKDVETMNRAIGRARRSLLRVLDTVEPGEAQKHTLQALASLQQTTSQCAHPPYQHTPPPNPHQVAAALTGVKLECAHHMMETAGPHRALVEDLLPDVRELCALVAEGAHLFHDMRWAREWAQVHRREDLAARAQELCEDTQTAGGPCEPRRGHHRQRLPPARGVGDTGPASSGGSHARVGAPSRRGPGCGKSCTPPTRRAPIGRRPPRRGYQLSACWACSRAATTTATSLAYPTCP